MVDNKKVKKNEEKNMHIAYMKYEAEPYVYNKR